MNYGPTGAGKRQSFLFVSICIKVALPPMSGRIRKILATIFFLIPKNFFNKKKYSLKIFKKINFSPLPHHQIFFHYFFKINNKNLFV